MNWYGIEGIQIDMAIGKLKGELEGVSSPLSSFVRKATGILLESMLDKLPF